MILRTISGVLESIAAPYALIGGRAVAFRGHPRLTIDYDFLTIDKRVFQRDTWKSVEESGARVDIRKGDFDDPLAGVVHITFDDQSDADVVVAKWNWEKGVIDRAERVTLEGVLVPIPRASDLILLKLAAGGYLDLQDAHSLLHLSDREQVIREVEEHLSDVRPDVTAAWKQLLATN